MADLVGTTDYGRAKHDAEFFIVLCMYSTPFSGVLPALIQSENASQIAVRSIRRYSASGLRLETASSGQTK